MCGLFGIAGTITKDELNVFDHLLILSQLRGIDSTGIAAVDTLDKDPIKIFKKDCHSTDFRQFKMYDKLTTIYAKVLLGHTRKATLGKVTSANAHPFEYGDIVGAHNGHISNKYDLKDSKEFDVDSEALIYNLALEGPEKVIPKLEGAWALTWYNKTQNRLFFIRNKERPLFFVFKEDNSAIYWASELGILHFCLNRCGVKVNKFKELGQDVLQSYVIPAKDKPFKKEEETRLKLEGYERPLYYTGRAGKDYISGHTRHFPTHKEEDSPKLPLVIGNTNKKKDYKSVVDIIEEKNRKKNSQGPHYTWFKGEQLTKEEFEKKVKNGCAWCGNDISWGEICRPIDHDRAICMDCIESDNVLGVSC